MALSFTVGRPSGVIWARVLGLVSGVVVVAVFLDLLLCHALGGVHHGPGMSDSFDGDKDAIAGGGSALRRLTGGCWSCFGGGNNNQVRGGPISKKREDSDEVITMPAAVPISKKREDSDEDIAMPAGLVQKVAPKMPFRARIQGRQLRAHLPAILSYLTPQQQRDLGRDFEGNYFISPWIYPTIAPGIRADLALLNAEKNLRLLRGNKPGLALLNAKNNLGLRRDNKPGGQPGLGRSARYIPTDIVRFVRKRLFGQPSNHAIFDDFVRFWNRWHKFFGGKFRDTVLDKLEWEIFNSGSTEVRWSRMQMVMQPETRDQAFWDRICDIVRYSMMIFVDFFDETLADEMDRSAGLFGQSFWTREVEPGLFQENIIRKGRHSTQGTCAAAGRYLCSWGAAPVFRFYLFAHLYEDVEDRPSMHWLKLKGATQNADAAITAACSNSGRDGDLILRVEERVIAMCRVECIFVTTFSRPWGPQSVLATYSPIPGDNFGSWRRQGRFETRPVPDSLGRVAPAVLRND